MSQLATRMVRSTAGNNALDLQDLHPAGQPAGERTSARARTPLSLVVSSPRRNRTPVVVSLFLLAVGALAAVLMMSVSVSQGQYELVALKGQQTTLSKSNQALELDLSAREAPQDLVARASGMGMVPAATSGQIDIRTKKVTGNPLPAAADTKGLVALPPADINRPATASNDAASAEAASKDAAAKGSAAPAQDGNAVAKAEKKQAAAQAGGMVAAPAPAPAVVTPDLNGGTIPAPAQKDS